jgi:hypothetical protein
MANTATSSTWLLQAATATLTDLSTHLLATLPQLTSETRSLTHPRPIAQAIPISSKTCFGQPVPSMLDAARPHVLLTMPTHLPVAWLRTVSSSTHTYSRVMERTQDSTVLSTNRPSLRRPLPARVSTLVVSPTHMATLIVSPTPPPPAVPLSLVQLPRLQASLAHPPFKVSVPHS